MRGTLRRILAWLRSVNMAGAVPWACVPPSSDELSEYVLHQPGWPGASYSGSSHTCGSRGEPTDVVKECEAFVLGHSHELLLGSHQRIPIWAYVNPLAHAERAEVARLASLSRNRNGQFAFLSYLAFELLLWAGEGEETLKRLQHDVLVPLELALLDNRRSSDLRELSRVIGEQLYEAPISRPRREGRT